MNREDKELQNELYQKIQGSYNKQAFYDLLKEILQNFSYRYIESDTTGVGEPILEGETLKIELYETDMVEALKMKQNRTIFEGVKELAKTTPRKDRPMVKYGIYCDVLDLDEEGGGTVVARCMVSWDFPSFTEKSNKKYIRKQKYTFQDFFEFRNKFPAILEDVCSGLS